MTDVPDLRLYRVNEPMMRRFASAFGIGISGQKGTEASVEVGGGPIKLSRKETRIQEPASVQDPILAKRVDMELRERGFMRGFRPERVAEWESSSDVWIVHEQLVATPVLLPIESVSPFVRMPEALTVWVGEPLDPTEEARDEWDWIGSYLFLVEELSEAPSYPYYVSGLSALRLLIEGIAKPLPEVTPDVLFKLAGGSDRYGRWFDDSPVEKLVQAGGIPQRAREIETTYLINYMTNEQSGNYRGRQVRVNDILAYPLYIAS